MAEPYKIVVGLEVHVQLLTQTKLFCGCRNKFGLPPNSATCPVCLGMPGSLPVMNRKAFRLAMRAALALNCGIAAHTKWDRKNYYYPDLPKNYQISQYDLPFSHDGFVEINVHPEPKKGFTGKKIGIIRAHLEEDAGKNTHDESGRGGDSRVDLNRTGTPLLEIVSQPDINTPEEAIAYLEEVRLMMRELGVSDCEMQEGSLRCDANVNIHVPDPSSPKGYAATPLVEVKNVNSFRAVGRAIKFEAQRHFEEFQKNPKFRIDNFFKTTAGWDDGWVNPVTKEKTGRTEVQRHKEAAADYRYFPEPDLVPVSVTPELIAEVRAEMGELPSAARGRLTASYGISAYDAEVIVAKGRPMVAYFEEVAKATGDGKAAANRLSDLVFPALSERREEIEEFPLLAEDFAEFIQHTAKHNKQDRWNMFQQAIGEVDPKHSPHFVHQGNVRARISPATKATWAPTQIDETALRAAVTAAVAANPRAVADFKKGKDAAKMSIVGAVMKANKGAANDVVRRLVDEELAKV